ncbi:hypothetical protein Tco_0829687 [Tanacetum coccineum]
MEILPVSSSNSIAFDSFMWYEHGSEVIISPTSEADIEFLAEIQGDKWVPTTADLHKMTFAHNNILKSQRKNGAEYEYHLQQIESFMNN